MVHEKIVQLKQRNPLHKAIEPHQKQVAVQSIFLQANILPGRFILKVISPFLLMQAPNCISLMILMIICQWWKVVMKA